MACPTWSAGRIVFRGQAGIGPRSSHCSRIEWLKEQRFFQKYGFLPVNHAYVIRGDIHRRYPWAAFNLYRAFIKAKEFAREKLLEHIPTALFFGREYLAMTRKMFGDDPFPYGVKANRAMLETLMEFSVEQGLTRQKIDIGDLFAESTRGL
ncbi:MAG TPA: hypothetical protein VE131_02750 [Terriglobales bacterium]|nr:hypothetical protein [Terriglobales bacterium]